jgi:hypothetical protein
MTATPLAVFLDYSALNRSDLNVAPFAGGRLSLRVW